MNGALPLTNRYRELLSVSSLMLAHARQQEWEALIQCEANYLVELDQVRTLDARVEPCEVEQRNKLELLEKILEQDAETRRLLEERRTELSRLLGNSRRQQALGQAYQGGVGNIASRLRAVASDERP